MDSEEKVDDFEYILKDIGGTFGSFQIFNYALFAVPLFLMNSYSFDYVFTTLDLDYRCQIPECEIVSSTDFNPYWLKNAVPFEDSKPMRCMRYQPILNSVMYTEVNSCEASTFNRSVAVPCHDGEFVFRTDEISIVNEFNITCEDINWRLPFIGAVNNIAKFIFLPIFGHYSDKFGRVPVLVTSAFIGSLFKLLSTFATSYEMFVVLSFLDNGVGSSFGAAFILALEWASAEKRILVSTIILSIYPFGQLLTGFVASQTHNYKWMLRLLSLPGILLIAYVWLAPESLRWLLLKKKYDRAIASVKHASKMNRIEPSQRTFDIIAAKCEIENNVTTASGSVAMFTTIFKSTKLLIRLAICILGSIGCIFVVYGINSTSVSLSGDKYWNFSIVALATAPAVILSYFSLTYMGRRWSMCSSVILSGVSIIASYYTSQYPTASLVLFFAGSLFIRLSIVVITLYVSELWPTSMRHTISNICTMFGRTGSILAPMTPLLAQYAESLSFFLIFGVAVVSGLPFLFLPETFDTKLPDTLEEAKSLGKDSENKSTK